MRGVCKPCDMRETNHIGLCASLPPQVQAELLQLGRRKAVSAHSVIFRDHDKAEYYFNVTSGIVKLVKTLADGEQHIVGLVYPADFLGHSPGGHHTYSAESATDVELCAFPRASFDAFMRDHPELQRQILEMTIRELDLCRDWMLLRGRKCSYERVAGFLLMIAGRMWPADSATGARNSAHFELPFTRAEMADYLGLTLETVSRQFTRLKTMQLIALPSSREVIIPDLELLSMVARIETCTERAHSDLERATA